MSFRFGQRVRVQCGATGRYVQDDLALVISAQDNELLMDRVDGTGEPHPTLRVPSDDALHGAAEALSYVQRGAWDQLAHARRKAPAGGTP